MENIKIIKDVDYDFDVVAKYSHHFSGSYVKFDELGAFDWPFGTDWFVMDENLIVAVNEDDIVDIECYWEDREGEFSFDDDGNYTFFSAFKEGSTEEFLKVSVERIWMQVVEFMEGEK